ncbi:MAG: tail fiber domain-containing protein [Bdellovibrionia bacterium]
MALYSIGMVKDDGTDAGGFGLVEVLLAVGIGSVVMMSMTHLMTSMTLSVRGTRTVSSRDQLSTRIGREAGNPISLKRSVEFASNAGFPGFPVNGPGSMMDKCANGTVPNGCIARDATTHNPISYGFTLTDSFSTPIAGPDATTAAVYDITGAMCGNASVSPPTKNCPIIATASFTPICANNQDACDRAASIDVQYNLSQAGNVPLLNGGPVLKPMAANVSTSIPFAGGMNGIVNMLAKWVSNTELASSSVYESSTGLVGIGTTSPVGTLEVQGGTATANTNGKDIILQAENAGSGNQKGGSIYLKAGAGSGTGNSGTVVVGNAAVPSYITPDSLYVTQALFTSSVFLSESKNGFADYGFGDDSTRITGSVPAGWVAVFTSSLERMRVAADGTITLGTAANPIPKFQVGTNGDGSVAIANAWNTFSDIRLKKDLERIPNACELVDRLNGYYYHWRDKRDSSRKIGVIAQEVEKVLPELVNTGSDGLKTVDYPKLSAVLIEASKKLHRDLASRKEEIDALHQQNTEIMARLSKLEKKLNDN